MFCLPGEPCGPLDGPRHPRRCRHHLGGFTLIELMMVVAILGVLAATAIPSLMKFVRRSKTSEATLNLRKIYDGSVQYFQAAHATLQGLDLPNQFPSTNALNPATIPAGTQASGANWDTATWIALSFGLGDTHRYSYQYVSNGGVLGAVPLEQKFTALAHGDLDGDSIPSTFARVGTVFQQEVRGGAGLYISRETE